MDNLFNNWEGLFAGLMAATPAVLFLVMFAILLRVRHDQEGIWLAFALGAASALPVIMLHRGVIDFIPLPTDLYAYAAYNAFFEAAAVEELFKLAAALLVLRLSKRQYSRGELVLICVAASCGFAALENIIYLLSTDDWIRLGIGRGLTSIPGHAFMGLVMGYFFQKAIFGDGGQGRFMYWAFVYVAPVAMHGAYNFPLVAINTYIERTRLPDADFIMGLYIRFLGVVIAEFVLAHWLAHRMVKRTAPSKSGWRRASLEAQVSLQDFDDGWARFNTFLRSRMCWIGTMGIYLVFAGYMLWSASNREITHHYALMILALLHCLMFAHIARLPERKRRSYLA